jgi:sortase (surface protein transpeptidase)
VGAAVLLATFGIGAMLPSPRGDDGATASTISLAPSIQPAVPVPAQPVAAEEPPATSMPESVPVGVSIPTLGVTSPVMELGLKADGSMQVPPGAYPAGWYELSPTPGELGPAVLAGHVDWAGEPGVFSGIGELNPGQEIVVARQDGSSATFWVDHVETYPKDSFPTDAVYGDLDHAGLRLITCGGEFDEDAGDYADNVVVFATLVGMS